MDGCMSCEAHPRMLRHVPGWGLVCVGCELAQARGIRLVLAKLRERADHAETLIEAADGSDSHWTMTRDEAVARVEELRESADAIERELLGEVPGG